MQEAFELAGLVLIVSALGWFYWPFFRLAYHQRQLLNELLVLLERREYPDDSPKQQPCPTSEVEHK